MELRNLQRDLESRNLHKFVESWKHLIQGTYYRQLHFIRIFIISWSFFDQFWEKRNLNMYLESSLHRYLKLRNLHKDLESRNLHKFVESWKHLIRGTYYRQLHFIRIFIISRSFFEQFCFN